MFGYDKILTLLLLCCSALRGASNQESRAIETSEELPKDCTREQFYYLPQSRCRNCSDIVHLFSSYQEWLGREVSDIRKSPDGSIRNNKLINRKQVRPDLLADRDAVLSRLISVDPQDQEFAADSNQDINDNNDSGFIESATDSTDIIKITKQTQKFIARFIRSSLIGNELLGAIDQCRQYQNISACQMWSNLCMMTMYSYSDIPTAQSQSSYDSNKANYEASDHPKKTWQKCRQFTVNSICNSLRDWYRVEKKSSLEMSNIYAVDEPFTKLGSGLSFRLNQAIQLLAYKYAYNGKLIGVDQFGLRDMEKFCFMSGSLRKYHPDQNHIKLGKNLQLRCQFAPMQASLFANKHFNETVFVDLFIGYPLNGAMFVKPVPILIKNLIYNGIQINLKHAKDPTRWKLVHRFLFHSRITLDNDELESEDILMYAKSAVLDFKFKRQEKGALLNTLLLSIDYGLLSIPNVISNSSDNETALLLESDITILQSLLDMQSYKKDLGLIMTILSILSSIWSLIKCYNIQKYFGVVKLDLDSLFRFIVIGCDTVSNLFATVTLAFLGYLFFSLKFQQNTQVLAPSEDLEEAIVLNLKLAFAFKLVGLAYKFYVQLNIDIFFIDWEKPKMLTSSQILNHASHYNNNSNQTKEQSKNQQKNNLEMNVNSNNLMLNQQSSFWRPYTVINRWVHMQTFRRQDLTLQLLLFVCMVDSFKLTNLATTDLNLELLWTDSLRRDCQQKLAPPLSLTFRLFILSLTYIGISMLQIAYKKYFHEPMIRNSVHEFIDLCSVANVSLFSMLYPRFGYYVHGRNPNGSGDCGISDMNALLEREERDLCSKRGLAPNSDHQTFVLILPKIINDHYKKLLLTADWTNSTQNVKPPSFNINNPSRFTGNGLFRSALNLSLSSSASISSNRPIVESIVTKNKAINLFLTNFLEHVYKDIDYSIRDRRRFESLLLDVDFDDESSAARNGPLAANLDKSTAATFCKDDSDSFTSLLWLGLEFDLVLVELFTLLILDLWLNQPLFITVSLVWLLQHIFKALYKSCARQNLVTKALVDDKFLLR